jgi:hypothetical protein
MGRAMGRHKTRLLDAVPAVTRCDNGAVSEEMRCAWAENATDGLVWSPDRRQFCDARKHLSAKETQAEDGWVCWMGQAYGPQSAGVRPQSCKTQSTTDA